MPNVFRDGPFPAATTTANWKLRWLILPLGILVLTATSRADSPPDDLIRQLTDKSSAVRRAAAEALGKLGDQRAVAPLITCLQDKDRGVGRAAAGSLVKIGQAAVKPLIACLNNKNTDVRRIAVQALSQLGDKRAVEPLIAYLRDKEGVARGEAANALGKLGDQQAAVPLIDCLKDARANVRRAAADALGRLGDKRAVEPLLACLKDEEAMVRRTTADALGKLGDKRAVEALIACLKDEETIVRGTAAEALGKLGDKAAVPHLVAALPDWPVNPAMIAALKLLHWEPATERERLYSLIGARDKEGLALDWEPSKRLLLEDAKSRDPKKVENAINTVIALARHEMVPDLVQILDTCEDASICEFYLNCGHPVLVNAGRRWATQRGYSVVPDASGSGPRWGAW